METPVTHSKDADLIVVGGGLAGLFAAALVARRVGRSSYSKKQANWVAGPRPMCVIGYIGISGRTRSTVMAVRSGCSGS